MSDFTNLLVGIQKLFIFQVPHLVSSRVFIITLDTGESPPVYKLSYRKSPAELIAIKAELERMLALNIICPSHSAWGAPCILVRKPLEKGLPQSPRFVVDYCGLNTVTSVDGYPIPSVHNILDALSAGKMFAKLGLASGYWQVLVNPKHSVKTAVATHLELFEFLHMPFGLETAPQTFQRILSTIFAEHLYKWLIIYIDDCIIWSSNPEEALGQYEKVFKLAVKFGAQFKPSKCEIFHLIWRSWVAVLPQLADFLFLRVLMLLLTCHDHTMCQQ